MARFRSRQRPGDPRRARFAASIARTGRTGVGKTQLAAAAAKVLKRPLVTRVVDSRTESRDLLWTFDAVMRLADAQVASSFLPAMTNVEPNGDEALPDNRCSPNRTSARRSTSSTM